MKTVGELGEFGLIREIQSILDVENTSLLLGMGDDAAVLPPLSRPSVVTTDAMVENVHFRLDWGSAGDVAQKLLASNLSDLAAKCAFPTYALITAALPAETPLAWVLAFYHHLAKMGKEWGVEIIGGDTVQAPVIFFSLTAWGMQQSPFPVRVDTAKVGDRILVTGTPGDALAGLEILMEENTAAQNTYPLLVDRFLRPVPRIQEMKDILRHAVPTSMTDISDGLARDLPKLCEAAGVGAYVDPASFPTSESLSQYAKSRDRELAWRGGEDYELLLTLSPVDCEVLLAHWDEKRCPLTVLGEVVPKERGITIEGWDSLPDVGFTHF